MGLKLFRSRLLWFAPGVLIGALVTGGIAYAAIPDSSTNVITGCRAPNGALRVIDKQAGQQCQKNETELPWNQSGPAGLPGAKGDTGMPGAKGVSGWEIVLAQFDLPPGTDASFVAHCPAGKVPLGGGYQTDGALIYGGNYPGGDPQGWVIHAAQQGGNTQHLNIFVTCMYA